MSICTLGKDNDLEWLALSHDTKGLQCCKGRNRHDSSDGSFNGEKRLELGARVMYQDICAWLSTDLTLTSTDKPIPRPFPSLASSNSVFPCKSF